MMENLDINKKIDAVRKQNIERSVIEYFEEGFSQKEISERMSLNIMKVNRILRNNGCSRSRSEAMKLAHEKGNLKPPFKGKALPDDVKAKIGKGRSESYNSLSDEEKVAIGHKISEAQKTKWTDAERKNRSMKALEGLRVASKEGSFLEKYLTVELGILGYDVIWHAEITPDAKEVDLYLPADGVVIEIDGPTHFNPIWGQEHLDKVERSDMEKNGILMNMGLTVIRINYLTAKRSKVYLKKVLEMLVEKLKEIGADARKRTLDERLIYIKV